MPSATDKKKKTPKRPEDRKEPTTRHGSSWRRPFQELTLPSGEVCMVRKVGVERLMEEGMLQSMDTLTSVVQGETIPKAQGKPPVNVKEIIDNSDNFDAMMAMINKIVVLVVSDPKVLNHQVEVVDEDGKTVTDSNERPVMRSLTDEEKDEILDEYAENHPGVDPVFTDWIDLQDRVFIMNFAVGGSADLAQFRAQAKAAVGGVPDGEAAEDAS